MKYTKERIITSIINPIILGIGKCQNIERAGYGLKGGLI